MKNAIYGAFLLCASLIIYCNTSEEVKVSEVYLNLQDSVAYMGMETCRSCHSNVYHSFMETGMGQSFDQATKEKTSAIFDEHAVVYDSLSNFYYRPYFEGEQMYVLEYRMEGKDTIHKRIEAIDYIIGSGHHTNSHIIDENGYVYQAPITYYTQEKRWDMAPGFDKENQRFSRFLTTECITCHNHLPDHVSTSLNKYTEMPRGIECERCHGPGEIHVKEKLAGNIVDTSQFIDYTIVNPRDLPKDLQMDLCQRCHLQGIPVLAEGKTFFDFKPGMKLSEVMNVYLPRYSNSHEQFIMASQADRLRLSACYQNSEELTCLTCHHPHHSVRKADKQSFNQPCQNCHTQQKLADCTAPMADRNAREDNCVGCHMPPSSSIDIPHVRITDHYISRVTDFNERQLNEQDQSEIAEFLGLQNLTKSNPSDLEMAQGYLAMYDKNLQESAILDSALLYLGRSDAETEPKQKAWVHFYFSRKDYTPIAKIAANRPAPTIKDAWMAYRIGEAFAKLGDFSKGLLYYKRATQLQKHNLEFQEKLGTTYMRMGSIPQAKKVFEFVLSENPKRSLALTNLGFVYVQLNQFDKARELYERSLSLDPDYFQGLINLAALEYYEKHVAAGDALVKRAALISPNDPQLRELDALR